MPGDELFKRYLEIGASVLGMSRERAESIVRDLVASGEVAKGQATKAADWLVERGRAGTEELAEMVRREIRQQIVALGLVTKDDLARVESRIDEVRASAANAATPTAAAAATPRAAKAPKTAKATRATRATTATKAEETAKEAKPAKAAGATKSAGISRSASVGKGPGASSSDGPATTGD
jgi:polyhydroxyalkanoate synthesis regulator phasin